MQNFKLLSSFSNTVYTIVQKIPCGKVATYKDVAAMAGNSNASRAVGRAMKNNPNVNLIPCHRVVGSDGSMHGYAFGKGEITKMELLKKEGVYFKNNKVDLNVSRWKL